MQRPDIAPPLRAPGFRVHIEEGFEPVLEANSEHGVECAVDVFFSVNDDVVTTGLVFMQAVEIEFHAMGEGGFRCAGDLDRGFAHPAISLPGTALIYTFAIDELFTHIDVDPHQAGTGCAIVADYGETWFSDTDAGPDSFYPLNGAGAATGFGDLLNQCLDGVRCRCGTGGDDEQKRCGSEMRELAHERPFRVFER